MRKTIPIILMIMVMLAACSNDGENNHNENEKQNMNSETNTTNEQDDNSIYPLTGIEANEDVERPIAVMVNNHPKARPQSGLSQADIVFEILAEGDITRFLAIFQSEKPDVVGPVRSAREYYVDLAEKYNAIYVYHGAANFVEDMIREQGIDHINGSTYDNDGHIFKRESFRKAPHNSYLQFNAVNDVAEQKGYSTTNSLSPLPFMDDKEEKQIEGDTAEHVNIAYATSWNVEYDYDDDSETYYRSSDGDPTIELNTEEPIEADNILIAETHHEVIDSEGRRAVDLDSGGDAYFIQKGKVQDVEWESQDGKIIPVKDGEPMNFVPGQTWINIVPTDPGIEQAVTISSH